MTGINKKQLCHETQQNPIGNHMLNKCVQIRKCVCACVCVRGSSLKAYHIVFIHLWLWNPNVDTALCPVSLNFTLFVCICRCMYIFYKIHVHRYQLRTEFNCQQQSREVSNISFSCNGNPEVSIQGTGWELPFDRNQAPFNSLF